MSVEELKEMVLEEFERRSKFMRDAVEKFVKLAKEDPPKALEFLIWLYFTWQNAFAANLAMGLKEFNKLLFKVIDDLSKLWKLLEE